jgi:hypothetical protein
VGQARASTRGHGHIADRSRPIPAVRHTARYRGLRGAAKAAGAPSGGVADSWPLAPHGFSAAEPARPAAGTADGGVYARSMPGPRKVHVPVGARDDREADVGTVAGSLTGAWTRVGPAYCSGPRGLIATLCRRVIMMLTALPNVALGDRNP